MGWRLAPCLQHGCEAPMAAGPQLAWPPFIFTSVTSNAPPYAGSFSAGQQVQGQVR